MENEKILFSITFDDCYRVFKHKYKNTRRAIVTLICKLMIVPILGFIIILLKVGNNFLSQQTLINKEVHTYLIIALIVSFIWCILFLIFNKFHTSSLARIDAMNYLEYIEKSKTGITLEKEFVKLSYYNKYENIYYKGIEDVFLIGDIIVILIKPSKIFILPRRAFKNIESFKTFMRFLNSKIK